MNSNLRMSAVLKRVFELKCNYAMLPFFEFLRDETIDVAERIAFYPDMAFFILCFGDLNNYALHKETTTNVFEARINTHKDNQLWQWYLEDFKKLGFDRTSTPTRVIELVLGGTSGENRRLMYRLTAMIDRASRLERIAIAVAIEETENVLFADVSRIAKILEQRLGVELRYCSSPHLKLARGHAMGKDNHDIAAFEIDPETYERCLGFVNEVFAVFTEWTHELLRFAKQQQKVPVAVGMGRAKPLFSATNLNVFSCLESNVRSYCRSFPVLFQTAQGVYLYDQQGDAYLDFFAGAGALNYGHNPPEIKQHLIDYLEHDGITHALDMHTVAKRRFIETFHDLVLVPKGLPYKLQFCGPTGANAVEAALKLARKVTGRTGVFAFMGGYHGMSLGALAATSNRQSRAGAGLPLHDVTFMPFPKQGFAATFNTIEYLESVLRDGHSGIDVPAAIIVEAIQAEGGVNIAPLDWLKRLRALCDEFKIILIADEIQVGCGRTGPFFAFEHAAIVPDMVTLSKSISGYGLPMALMLMKPELDQWSPGEHNGTFRGHQLAFVAATAALEQFIANDFETRTTQLAGEVEAFLRQEIKPLHEAIEIRGAGLIWGIDVARAGGAECARQVAKACFECKLIIERVGRDDTVLKIMPPLVIESGQLQRGLTILRDALRTQLACIKPSVVATRVRTVPSIASAPNKRLSQAGLQ